MSARKAAAKAERGRRALREILARTRSSSLPTQTARRAPMASPPSAPAPTPDAPLPVVRVDVEPADRISDEVAQLEWAIAQAARDRKWSAVATLRARSAELRRELEARAAVTPMAALGAEERRERWRLVLRQVPPEYLDDAMAERLRRAQ